MLRLNEAQLPKIRTSSKGRHYECGIRNSAKGTNAAGYDPDTGVLVPLFNPRLDAWENHFSWNGPMLLGTSPIARATIDVLRINDPVRIAHRRLLIIAGQFGPP